MSYPWIVEGTVELCPPVPFARLRELLDQAAPRGGFEVAPHGLDESELTRLVDRARWVLVPEGVADAGTDDGRDRPRAIKYLRVNDPGIEALDVDERIRGLSACMGAAHEFRGRLRYWGDTGGEDGEIVPSGEGGAPYWRQIGGRYW
ncbi:hypothetical protein [Streptomyces sp. NBC_00199]|uniref:hypothetical protein n=1 Tax=Streptomyces sp. NBC_00199 TaxID=2975678 RepID=UPI00224F6FB5|nr:hypothetical protein [Streptomyces sp. NBC_00199]MCX5264674.1 hypothetical protein [Streptomyces sp. NBC_00199]